MGDSMQLEIDFNYGDIESLSFDSPTMLAFGKNLTPLEDVAKIYKLSLQEFNSIVTPKLLSSYECGMAIARARIRQNMLASKSPIVIAFLGRELLGIGKDDVHQSEKALNAAGKLLENYYGLDNPR